MPQVKQRGMNAFTGGVNNVQSPVFVADDESTDEYGFDFDEYPNRTVRKGKTTYGASGNAQTNLMTNFKDTHLVRAVGTQLQYNSSGTTWTNISGTYSNSDWSAANFEVAGDDALILTNGVDPVKYWNGSTLANLSSNAPTGRYITADPSRIFIAKDNILYWCGFQDAKDWTSKENSGFADYYTYGGGNITALMNFRDIKYIWKEDAMAGLYGTNFFDFRIVEVSNNIGCVSHKTVKEVNGKLFWLGQQDVYQFTQGNPIPIGEKIRGFLNRINRAHIGKCTAFTDGLRYYLCLVIDNATEPNLRLVWDTRYDRWRVPAYNENFRYGVLFKNAMYVGDSNGQTWKVNDGTTDNGVAIPWYMDSKAFSEGIMEAEKEYKEIHVQGLFSAGSTVNVSISTESNGDSFVPIQFNTNSPSAIAQNRNMIIPLDTTPLTNWFRYRIYGTGPVSLYEVQRYFRVCRVQH